jgi:F-type H+-transporting ATPase subunit delta
MSTASRAALYAQALFESATGQNCLERISADLQMIERCIAAAPREFFLLNHPSLGSAQQQQILDTTLGASLHLLTRNLLRTLVQRRALILLPHLGAAFASLVDAVHRVLHVHVRSATALTPALKQQLLDKLTQRTGRVIQPSFDVDRSLIGGMQIHYEDTLIDTSVQGSLERLRKQLQDAPLGSMDSPSYQEQHS